MPKNARAYGTDLMKGEGGANYVRKSKVKTDGSGHPSCTKWAEKKGMKNKIIKIEEAESGAGTSVFDPVLCEIVYRWFCPDGGSVIDPFAGGSVRGIVAGYLGHPYTGIDLRADQIAANEIQAETIFNKPKEPEQMAGVPQVTISSKWANHLFQCSEDYITKICHGSCCQGSDRVLISLLPEEAERQEEMGFPTENGLLLPSSETGKCPHKKTNGLCSLHFTEDKPYGCIASPFTLNSANTLIIRNRYNMMKCHGKGNPAYVCFRASLDKIFGEHEAERICNHLSNGGGNIKATISEESYNAIKYLDGLKHGIQPHDQVKPRRITGNSEQITELAQGQYDLVFSCPPYYDLEVYSDNAGDLSALGTYDEFIVMYRNIIAQCCGMLKDNRFACFVVGDIRDKKGFYRGFVGDTISAFEDAGCTLYNEGILVNVIGSLPIRITKQFEYRKLGKCHQNVLVFFKGDPKKIKDELGVINLPDEIFTKE